jgi:hypothetical protein
MSELISLSMQSDAFNGFKQDYDMLLNTTLNTMQKKGVDVATITAKFEIHLIEGIDETTKEAVARAITIPMFKHKITAAMKLQSELSGTLGGTDYELVWNKKTGSFAMVPVKSAQQSMFDDYDYEEDEL